MEVIVTGWRSTTDAWAKAHFVGPGELPELSPEQAEVAQKMGLSVEEYARSFYAGELSKPELANKAGEVGRLVETLAKRYAPGARVDRVLLETYLGLLRLDGRFGKGEFHLEVEEGLADDLMRGGAGEKLERLKRMVRFALLADESA